ncbi:hypothetical protein [Undibacterium sp.]|uniref:hypothetical protein n=1 Tax=Undibacterium sp. TaxID=1914977 RepID=UPI0025F12514|nr:hypothetical protein [Undibacterium sp.]
MPAPGVAVAACLGSQLEAKKYRSSVLNSARSNTFSKKLAGSALDQVWSPALQVFEYLYQAIAHRPAGYQLDASFVADLQTKKYKTVSDFPAACWLAFFIAAFFTALQI